MPPKRIKRITPAEVQVNVEEAIDPEDVAIQTNRTAIRRRKGCLQSVLNLPLDVLHEIFKHLLPLDLLHLARSTKQLRSFILNKNTIGVWRNSLRNVDGLPECPSFMSLPEYANLMFDPRCHNCLTLNVHNAIIQFGVRYCASCRRANTVSSFMLGGRKGYTGGLTEDMFSKTLGERKRPLYHKPEVEEIWHLWLSIPEGNSDLREAFQELRRKLVQETQAHAELCYKWFETRKTSRLQQISERKQAKLDIVVDKLRALGWEEELEQMESSNYSQLADNGIIRSTKTMTERAWEDIEPQITQFMVDCKRQRLIQKYRQQIHTRLGWFKEVMGTVMKTPRNSFSDLQPHYVDIALMPEFRELGEAPISANITKDDYLALRDIIPELQARWWKEVSDQLLRVVRLGMKDIPQTPNVLRLAMISFDCSSCRRKRITHPAVIAHHCLRPHYWGHYPHNVDSTYVYEDIVQTTWEARPWICPLVLSRNVERARRIIQAFGEDPDTISSVDMHKVESRICCKACSTSQFKVVMSWEAAIEHDREEHSAVDQQEAVWELVSLALAAQARAAESYQRHKDIQRYASSARWSCARCPDPYTCRDQTHTYCVDHVRRSHGVQNPSLKDGDLYMTADSPPYVMKPIVGVHRDHQVDPLTPLQLKIVLEGTVFPFDEEDEEALEA